MDDLNEDLDASGFSCYTIPKKDNRNDSISDRITNRLTFDRPVPALTPAQRYHLVPYVLSVVPFFGAMNFV